MINRIHAQLYRPENGWDPIPRDYAETYAQAEWDQLDHTWIEQVESRVGPLKGKHVLDLGAGPGSWSYLMASRGARVIWHDVSANYLTFFRERLTELDAEHKLDITFSLGYMEDVVHRGEKYDLILSRLSWSYCQDDFRFAEMIRSLLVEGGAAYVIANHEGFPNRKTLPVRARVFRWCNEVLGVKIGHPFPSKRHLQRVIASQPFSQTEFEFDDECTYAWLFA